MYRYLEFLILQCLRHFKIFRMARWNDGIMEQHIHASKHTYTWIQIHKLRNAFSQILRYCCFYTTFFNLFDQQTKLLLQLTTPTFFLTTFFSTKTLFSTSKLNFKISFIFYSKNLKILLFLLKLV